MLVFGERRDAQVSSPFQAEDKRGIVAYLEAVLRKESSGRGHMLGSDLQS